MIQIQVERKALFICLNDLSLSFKATYLRKDADQKTLKQFLEENFNSFKKQNPHLEILKYKTFRNIKEKRLLDNCEDCFPIYFQTIKKELLDQQELIFNIELENKLIKLKVTQLTTIEQIKNQIKLQQQLNSNDFFLKWKNILVSDEQTVYELKIPNNETLKLNFELVGGFSQGINFVSMDQKLIKQKQPSKTAPKWRIISHGINIEGKCTNAQCEAYSRYVIFRIGFIDYFDLIEDFDKVQCPLCKIQIIPLTCGFYKCSYSYTGIQIKDNTPKKIWSNWKYVGSMYEKFKKFQENQVRWTKLKIHCKQNSDINESACAICSESEQLETNTNDTQLQNLQSHQNHVKFLQQSLEIQGFDNIEDFL